MIKLRQLLGKNIVEKQSEKTLGNFVGIAMDKQTGKCLFATEESLYAVDGATVFNDGITVDNAREVDKLPYISRDKPVYDFDGKLIGQVCNAEIGKTLNLVRIVLNNGEIYSKGKIRAVGDIILIKLPQEKTKKASVKQSANIVKKVESYKPENTPTEKHNARNNETLPRPYPNKRRYCDFTFLLGKTADKNITNFYGETMLKQGEKVTADILRQAKLSGKLVELCLHTK